MVKIASWNVNSVKSRIEHICNWLKETKCDILLLQELKTIEENFPREAIEDLGYNLSIVGQKTYNGVAILSKFPIEEEIKSLPLFDIESEDPQARYVEAVISLENEAIRVVSVYVPNGQEIGSEKHQYKMRFFKRLQIHLQELLSYDEKLFIGGDFNVANLDIDVFDPESLEGKIGFEISERKELRKFINLGMVDSFRFKNPDIQEFSWWDYRAGGFQQNKGMRIDYIFASPLAIEAVKSADIDTKPRGLEKPSDHCPVLVTTY
jgi:exodeoxyribonuclease III